MDLAFRPSTVSHLALPASPLCPICVCERDCVTRHKVYENWLFVRNHIHPKVNESPKFSSGIKVTAVVRKPADVIGSKPKKLVPATFKMLKTSYEYMRLSAWLAGWLAGCFPPVPHLRFFFSISRSPFWSTVRRCWPSVSWTRGRRAK